MLRRTAQDPPFSLRRNVSRTLPTPRRGLVIAALALMALGLVVGLLGGGLSTSASAEAGTPTAAAQQVDTTLAPASLGGSGTSTSTSVSDDTDGTEGGFVAVLKVSGLLDPVLVDAVSTAAASAERL